MAEWLYWRRRANAQFGPAASSSSPSLTALYRGRHLFVRFFGYARGHPLGRAYLPAPTDAISTLVVQNTLRLRALHCCFMLSHATGTCTSFEKPSLPARASWISTLLLCQGDRLVRRDRRYPPAAFAIKRRWKLHLFPTSAPVYQSLSLLTAISES